MSCILYSRNNYLELAKTAEFQSVFYQTLRSPYLEPKVWAEALHLTNVKAYSDRYNEDFQKNLEESQYGTIEHIFRDLFNCYNIQKRYARLSRLLSSIEYQLCDMHHWQESEIKYHLARFHGEVIRKMEDIIDPEAN